MDDWIYVLCGYDSMNEEGWVESVWTDLDALLLFLNTPPETVPVQHYDRKVSRRKLNVPWDPSATDPDMEPHTHFDRTRNAPTYWWHVWTIPGTWQEGH